MTRGTDGFLDLTGARTDGRALTITGAGNADITTPATFTAGPTYTIHATHQPVMTTREATADPEGRLPFALDVGAGEFGTAKGATPGTTTLTVT